MNEEKILYRLNDDIVFRKCSLFDGKKQYHGDCTDFSEREENWRTYYDCNSYGIHLHCAQHPAIELDYNSENYENYLICPRCKRRIYIRNKIDIINQCLKMLNVELFKDAKFVRLDDWYVPEVKKKEKTETGYWITTDVKTDRDGDTIIVIYVGHKDSAQKAQYFIKPEKKQLTSDHKDMDPAKVISRIEVTLKDRTLRQEYEEE